MSLEIESTEEHFVIPLRHAETGEVKKVAYLRDLDWFYTGYAPEFRLFFKDEWEIVRRQPEPQSRVLTLTATIGGTLVLIAIIGCIAHILMS